MRAPLGEDHEPVDRLSGGARPADRHAREIREPARADERLRVVVGREQLDRRLRLAMEAIDRDGRRRQLELDLPAAHLRQRAGDLVDAGRSVELVEHADGLGVASGFHERLAEVHDDAGARRMPRGQQGRRTSEQSGRRVEVGAARSPPPGRREALGGACAERLCLVVDGAELGAVAVALLEVVPEDLLVLDDPRGDQALQPVGELPVEVRTELLRGRVVGGVPDEDVLEAEGRLAREARLGGADEVLGGEGLEARLHRRARGGLRELDDGATVEDLALDRATLERGACLGLEPVEARAEERVQARREGERVEVALEGADAVLHAQHALVHEHRDELLDEEGVATRRSREPCAHGGLRAAEQALEQRVDLVLAERLEAQP